MQKAIYIINSKHQYFNDFDVKKLTHPLISPSLYVLFIIPSVCALKFNREHNGTGKQTGFPFSNNIFINQMKHELNLSREGGGMDGWIYVLLSFVPCPCMFPPPHSRIKRLARLVPSSTLPSTPAFIHPYHHHLLLVPPPNGQPSTKVKVPAERPQNDVPFLLC